MESFSASKPVLPFGALAPAIARTSNGVVTVAYREVFGSLLQDGAPSCLSLVVATAQAAGEVSARYLYTGFCAEGSEVSLFSMSEGCDGLYPTSTEYGLGYCYLKFVSRACRRRAVLSLGAWPTVAQLLSALWSYYDVNAMSLTRFVPSGAGVYHVVRADTDCGLEMSVFESLLALAHTDVVRYPECSFGRFVRSVDSYPAPPSVVLSPASRVGGSDAGELSSPVDGVQVGKLDEYHAYLSKHYAHGVDRFFSPTGFLKKFERAVAVEAGRRKDAVYVKSVDEAQSTLEPVVAGGEGVFDLVAEPGTGKTTVLPFRFPTKRVVVALPTPFDAWNAFNTASGPAMLKLKGLSLGKHRQVCYMDSYLAANMVLSGFMDYDVLIVDECDSGKGVTGFLAEVKAPGKVLIRMSASHGRSESGPSSSFGITEDPTMPDVREGYVPAAAFVASRAKGRSLVMAPDADVAAALAALIPGSKLVTSKVPLGDLARTLRDQQLDGVYVCDDVCSRSLNLNLDMVFDCQLVTEHAVTRNITVVELYQRKNRVGRNRPGWYLSPGLGLTDARVNDADQMRNNVVRCFAGVPQGGSECARLTEVEAGGLLESAEEPFAVQTRTAVAVQTVRGGSSGSSEYDDATSGRRRSSASSHRSQHGAKEVAHPAWLLWLASATGKPVGKKATFRVARRDNGEMYHCRSPSLSGSGGRASLRELNSPLAVRSGLAAPKPKEYLSEEGVYGAVSKSVSREVVRAPAFEAPRAPPVMDLSQSEYEIDWPMLLGELMERCGDLPTIVPPNNWRHTAQGGVGSNWLARLDALAAIDLSFRADEMEVVCRAWNAMVAGTWVRRAPGLSAYANRDHLEFCLRYFQSYFNLAMTG